MRVSGCCPKCNSNQIAEFKGSLWSHAHIKFYLSTFRWTYIDNCVCMLCGYKEEYIQLSPKTKKWLAKNKGFSKTDDYV